MKTLIALVLLVIALGIAGVWVLTDGQVESLSLDQTVDTLEPSPPRERVSRTEPVIRTEVVDGTTSLDRQQLAIVVRDEGGGRLEGATVEFFEAAALSSAGGFAGLSGTARTTDHDGVVTIPLPTKRLVMRGCYHDLVGSSPIEITTLVAGATMELILRARGAGNVLVVDEHDRPIEGVLVASRWLAPDSVWSDATGRAALRAREDAPLAIRPVGFAVLASAQNSREEWVIKMASTTLDVRIVTPDDTPLSNAVRVCWAPAADPKGGRDLYNEFGVRDAPEARTRIGGWLPGSTAFLHAAAPGRSRVLHRVQISASEPTQSVTLTLGKEQAELRVPIVHADGSPVKAERFVVRVLRDPVPDATRPPEAANLVDEVSLFGLSAARGSVTTDDTGVLHLRMDADVPTSLFLLRDEGVAATSFRSPPSPASLRVDVPALRAGSQYTTDPLVEKDEPVVAAGRVQTEDGTACAGVLVTVVSASRNERLLAVRSAEDGTFTLKAAALPRRGTLSLVAVGDGMRSEPQPLASGKRDVVLVMAAISDVTGRIRFEGVNKSLSVELTADNIAPKKIITKPDGTFSFPELTPGTYTLLATVDRLTVFRCAEIRVGAGIGPDPRITDVSLPFSPVRVQVNVMDVREKKLKRARVRLTVPIPGLGSQVVSHDTGFGGSAVLTTLSGVPTTVDVSLHGYHPKTLEGVTSFPLDVFLDRE